MIGPNGPHLFLGCEFTTGGGGLGRSYSGAFVGRKLDRRRLVVTGKLKNNAGDVILGVHRQTAHGLERLV